MNREALERPFEAAQIKTRRGNGGKTLSYVEGADVIRRLNEAFDGRWSFEIESHHQYESHVVVVGKLTGGGVTKMAFGGSSITVNANTGEVLNVADDLKAAATDALKKAASMLGVALHLYSDDPLPNRTRSRSAARSTRQQEVRPTSRSNGRNNRSAPATSAQVNAIYAISRSRGIDRDELRGRSEEMFGVEPDALSKTEASAFISSLQQEPEIDQRRAS